MVMFTLSNMTAVSMITYQIVLSGTDLTSLFCDFLLTAYSTHFGAELQNLVSETFYTISNVINEGFENQEVIDIFMSDHAAVRDLIKYFVETLKIR